MANKYILNTDGSISKYVTDEDTGITTLDSSAPDAPANGQSGSFSHDAVNSNIAFASLNPKNTKSLASFNPDNTPKDNDDYHLKIVASVESNKNFGFKGGDVSPPISYKSFNTYQDKKTFADEFEILGGVRFDEDKLGVGVDLSSAIFTYFAESILRLALVEAIVLLNRAVVSIANGKQSRTAERYVLRIGTYDFTEYDLFTRYVYNVLNYPHESSNMPERLVAYFVGFSEWLCPDILLDISEIVKETSKYDKNDLDFFSSMFTYSDRKGIILLASELGVIAYAAIKVMVAGLTNQTVQNRANLLIRKFYQEKYWRDNVLYGDHKKEESAILDVFTDLNYYYFRFYIERVQVGLKLIGKYVYDDSYLQGRLKDSSFNRVSANRSNMHIDYAIQILTAPGGLAISGDVAEVLSKGEYKPDTKKLDSITQRNAKIDEANKLLPSYLQIPKAAVPKFDLAYEWHNKHTDGFYDHPITKNKKPGQSTRIRALPQLFSMHPSLYSALAANGQVGIELGKDLTQNFYDLDKSEKRIPEYVVNEIENVLEAEYMPFYLHDVRTNEILSFHAFIESITDSFNPEYNSSSGFGRIDDVRTYVKTTRNINLTYTLAATSESDHDLMWYQINKIVAMVYPQWSDGYSVKDRSAGDFKFPFSQVPTASPLIRLRVGDVIKSNYSRTNLSRLHGVGERKKDKGVKTETKKKNFELAAGLYKTNIPDQGLDLLPNSAHSFLDHVPKTISLSHSVPCKPIDEHGDFYVVEIENPYFVNDDQAGPAGMLKIPPDVPDEQRIKVVADSTRIIVKNLTTITEGSASDDLMKPVVKEKQGTKFKSNNPITRAYESGISRGLAGFITQLDVNYNEVNWETSRIGSKAPILVKITINFAPIHDIPPGLDHNGMLRAPVYNVGRINNQFFGDPKDHSYVGSGRDMALAKYKFLDYHNKKKHKS